MFDHAIIDRFIIKVAILVNKDGLDVGAARNIEAA